MIPISLKIKGFYSYKEEQLIQFSPLVDAGLFGIFGQVGSGKSTILEAIILALYGVSEKLGARTDSDLINLESDSLSIDFIFWHANKKYRFTFFTRRGKDGKVRGTKKDRFVWREGEFIPISETAEEILGLDISNFEKTIVIPQGKFIDFLELKNKERSLLLENIFSLSRFDYSANFKLFGERLKMEISALEGEIKGLGNISKKELEEKEVYLNEKERIGQVLSQKIFDWEDKLEKLTEIRKHFLRKKELENEYRELTSKKEEMELLEKKIKEGKEIFSIKPLWEEYQKDSGEIGVILKNRDNIKRKLTELKTEGQEFLAVFEKITGKYQRLDKYLERVTFLKSILEKLKNLKDLSLIKIPELEKKQSFLLAEKKKFLEELAEEEKLVSRESEIEKELENLQEVLLKKQNDWEKFNLKFKNFEQFSSFRLKREKKISYLKELEENLWLGAKIFDGVEMSFFSEELFLSKEKEWEVREEEMERELKELALKSELKRMVGDLEEGKPCPLCGALTHPQPIRLDDNFKKIELLKREKRELANLKKRLWELRNSWSEWRKEKLSLKELENEIEEWQELNSFTNDLKKEDLIEEKEILKEELSRLSSHKDRLKNEREIIKEKKEKIVFLKDKLDKIEKNLSTVEGELKVLKFQEEDILSSLRKMINLNFKKELSFLISQLERIISKKEKAIFDLKDNYQKVYRQKEALEKEISDLTNKLLNSEDKLNYLKERVDILRNKLKEKLKKFKIEDLNGLEGIFRELKSIFSQEENVLNFKKQLFSLEKELEKLNNYLKKYEEFKEEDYQRLKEELILQKEKLQSINQEIGELRGNLKDLQARWKRYQELSGKLEELSERWERFRELKSLLSRREFINFILQNFVKNLLYLANQKFKRFTNNTLELVMAPNVEKNKKFNLDFAVKDFYNSGKIRSIKTLSGGQKFLASLALALALSQIIQRGEKQEFFFIDEGFGALDEESLSLVIETLFQLSREGKVVGIISHVNSLRNEVENYLEVVNLPSRGSIIKFSKNSF